MPTSSPKADTTYRPQPATDNCHCYCTFLQFISNDKLTVRCKEQWHQPGKQLLPALRNLYVGPNTDLSLSREVCWVEQCGCNTSRRCGLHRRCREQSKWSAGQSSTVYQVPFTRGLTYSKVLSFSAGIWKWQPHTTWHLTSPASFLTILSLAQNMDLAPAQHRHMILLMSKFQWCLSTIVLNACMTVRDYRGHCQTKKINLKACALLSYKKTWWDRQCAYTANT